MPIRPELLHLYPTDWAERAAWIKHVRAGGRCECTGECGRVLSHLAPGDARCWNEHGKPKFGPPPNTVVILTCAHLDHDPTNSEPDNLRAFCPGCHLAYDAEHRKANRLATLAARRRERERAALDALGMDPLFDVAELLRPA